MILPELMVLKILMKNTLKRYVKITQKLKKKKVTIPKFIIYY